MPNTRTPLEIVVVESDDPLHLVMPDFVALLHEAWTGPVHVRRAERLAVAVDMLQQRRADCVVLDLALPDASGLGAVLKLRNSQPQVPVVVLTDVDVELGPQAVQAGAQDFLPRRSADAPTLVRAIRYAIERGRIDARRADEARVLEHVARGSALPGVLREVAELVERHGEDLLCGIYFTDGATLRVAAAPSLPSSYLESVHGTAVGPTAGPGACVHRRQPVLAANVAVDEQWEGNRPAALAHGLRAAWAAPVLAADGRQILGVLTVYARRPRRPDLDEQRLLDQAVTLASIAMDRARIQVQLSHAALHDGLTGLPNRNLFMDRLALALARARRPAASASGPLPTPRPTVAVLFIDLDGFKDINDTLGHEAGDELLICAADRLRRIIRPSDTVSRFGGDEFVILCDGLGDPRDAERVAGRVASAFQAPYSIADQQVRIGASIGVALAGPDLAAPDELLRAADMAMYRAKEAGRNRYEVAGGAPDTPQRHLTEQELRQALQLSVGHPATGDRPPDAEQRLTLLYQRIIGVPDGALVGVEALVRWLHPQRGLLLPDEFMTIAEASELIVPIDHWVLRRACRALQAWQTQKGHGGPVTVCVNLSERSLLQFDLPAVVSDSLEWSGLAPESLCLEVAERSLVKASEATRANLRELAALGVRFAVDGYGEALPLSALGELPISAVKVNAGVADPRVLRAAVQAARVYDLVVIAQGVESADHLSRVRQLGCDCVQGRYLGRPELVTATIDLVDVGGADQAARPARPSPPTPPGPTAPGAPPGATGATGTTPAARTPAASR
jgi:diguanylate cyclase (GGDEF)-like protein